MGTESFRLSRETKKVLGENIDFFDSVKGLNHELSLGLKGGDLEAHTEAETQPNGDLQVTFVFPLDNNDNPTDGRIYLKDRFVFDASQKELKSYQRLFELNDSVKDNPQWKEWVGKYQASLKNIPLNDPALQRFAFQVGLSYAHPITPPLKAAFKSQIDYLKTVNKEAQAQDPSWTLKIGDDQCHYSVVQRDKDITLTISIPVDNDDDPANGRVFFHDRFVLDAKTLEMKPDGFERLWTVAPEVQGDSLKTLKKLTDKLNKEKDPEPEELKKYLNAVLPVLQIKAFSPSEGGDATTILQKAAQTHPLPKDYQSSFSRRAELRKAWNEGVNAATQEGLAFAYTFAQEDLTRRYDESRGWLSGEKSFTLEGEKALLDQVFQKAQAAAQGKMQDGFFKTLSTLSLEGEEARVRDQLLANPQLQRINSLSQDGNAEFRAQAWIVMAREELLKNGYGSSATAIAEKFKDDADVKVEAGKILDFVQSGGSIATKMEYLVPLYAQQVTKPSMVVAMVGSGLLGPAAEMAGLKLFSLAGKVGPLGRMGAGLIGITGEAAAFTTIHKFGDSLTNNPDKVWEHWGSETLSAALLFGGMRIAHGGAGWMGAKMAEGRFGTWFGGKLPSITEGATAPGFQANPLGRLQWKNLPEMPAPDLVPHLTRLGHATSFVLNHGSAIGLMDVNARLGQAMGLAPANHQSFGGGLFDATVMYSQALVGFGLANGATGGRLQPAVGEMKMRLDSQAKAATQEKGGEYPAWERFLLARKESASKRLSEFWDAQAKKTSRVYRAGETVSDIFAERKFSDKQVEKIEQAALAKKNKTRVQDKVLQGIQEFFSKAGKRAEGWGLRESLQKYFELLRPSKQKVLRETLEAKKVEIDQLTQGRQQLQAELDAAQAEKTRLEEILDEKVEEELPTIPGATDAPLKPGARYAQSLREEISAAKSEHGKAKAEVERLTRDLEAVRGTLDEEANASADKSKRIGDLEAEQSRLSQTVEEKNQELEGVNKKLEGSVLEQSRLEAEIQKLTREKASALSDAESKGQELERRGRAMDELRQANEQVSRNVRELTERVQTLYREKQTALDDASAKQGQIDALKADLQAAGREQARKLGIIEELEAQKTNAEQLASAEKDRADELQIQLELAQATIARRDQSLGEKDQALAKATRTNTEQLEELTRVDTERQNAEEDARERAREIGRLERELAARDAKIKELEDNIEMLEMVILDDEPDPIHLDWAEHPESLRSSEVEVRYRNAEVAVFRTRQEMGAYYKKALELEQQKEQHLQLPEPNRIMLGTIVEEHAETVRRSNASLVSLTRAREVAAATKIVLLEVKLREAQEALDQDAQSKGSRELRFTTELGAAKKDLETQKGVNAATERELSRTKEANAELERQLAEARQELKSLAATRGELEALQGGLEELRQQAAEARTRAETAERNLADGTEAKRIEVEGILRDLESANREKEFLEGQLTTKTREFEDKSQELSAATARIEELETEQRGLRQEMQGKDDELIKLQDEVKRLEEIETLPDATDDALDEKEQELQEKIEGLEREKRELKETQGKNERELTELKATLAEREEKVGNFSEALQQLQTDLDASQAEVVDAQRKWEGAKSEAARQAQRDHEAVVLATGRAEAAEARAGAAEARIEAAEARAAAAELQEGQTKDAFLVAQDEVARLTPHAELKQHFENELGGKLAEIEGLTQWGQQAEDRALQLGRKAAELEQKALELEDNIRSAERVRDQAIREKEAAEAEAEGLRSLAGENYEAAQAALRAKSAAEEELAGMQQELQSAQQLLERIRKERSGQDAAVQTRIQELERDNAQLLGDYEGIQRQMTKFEQDVAAFLEQETRRANEATGRADAETTRAAGLEEALGLSQLDVETLNGVVADLQSQIGKFRKRVEQIESETTAAPAEDVPSVDEVLSGRGRAEPEPIELPPEDVLPEQDDTPAPQDLPADQVPTVADQTPLVQGTLLELGQSLPLQGETTLGRSPDCQIVIPDRDISRHHLKFRQEEGTWQVMDLGSYNGTFLNDQGISDHVWRDLHSGDLIQIGREGTMLRFESPDDGTPPRLLHVDPNEAPVSVGEPDNGGPSSAYPSPVPPPGPTEIPLPAFKFPPDKTAVSFGRTPGGQGETKIQINDQTVSETHAKIYRTPQGYIFEHLSNSNASFVRNADGQVAEVLGNPGMQYILSDGQIVQLGATQFIFRTTEGAMAEAIAQADPTSGAKPYRFVLREDALRVAAKYSQALGALYGDNGLKAADFFASLYKNFPELESRVNPDLLFQATDLKAQRDLFDILQKATTPEEKKPEEEKFWAKAKLEYDSLLKVQKPVEEAQPTEVDQYYRRYQAALFKFFGRDALVVARQLAFVFKLKPELEALGSVIPKNGQGYSNEDFIILNQSGNWYVKKVGKEEVRLNAANLDSQALAIPQGAFIRVGSRIYQFFLQADGSGGLFELKELNPIAWLELNSENLGRNFRKPLITVHSDRSKLNELDIYKKAGQAIGDIKDRLEAALKRLEAKPAEWVLPPSVKTVVGRGAQSNIRFDDSLFSNRHLEIWKDHDSQQWLISDLGSTNGTLVNSFRLNPNQVTQLPNGSMIQIGTRFFHFEAQVDGQGKLREVTEPASAWEAAPPESGAGAQNFSFNFSWRPVPNNVIKIGRLHLSNPLVSGEHLEAMFNGSQWIVRDAGSKHGSFIDGREISRPPDPRKNGMRDPGEWVAITSGNIIALANAALRATILPDRSLKLEQVPYQPPVQNPPPPRPKGPPFYQNQVLSVRDASLIVLESTKEEAGTLVANDPNNPMAHSFSVEKVWVMTKRFGTITNLNGNYLLKVEDKALEIVAGGKTLKPVVGQEIPLREGTEVKIGKMTFKILF